ncbi:hypothetical protein ACLOJK_002425 [Asimina triloba]
MTAPLLSWDNGIGISMNVDMSEILLGMFLVLIIFRDGLVVLWGIQESKVLFITGGKTLLSSGHEARKVTSSCWACPFGTKVVVGYSNGEILVWSIPGISNQNKASATDKGLCATQNVPISKINLGYKMDRIPIVSLGWVPEDGKAGRLYVNGTSDTAISNSFQVDLANVKEQFKNQIDLHIILLNDSAESRTIKLMLPLPEACQDMEIISTFGDINKYKPDSLVLLLNSGSLCVYDDSEIEKYLIQSQSRSPPTLPKQVMVKLPFVEASITASKYITDNPDLSGAEDKSEGNQALSGVPITALYFDISSRVLVSGDQSGTVKSASSSSNLNKAMQETICSLYKVLMVDMEGSTVIYQKQYLSELYTGIVSLQFDSEKNILLVALKDSSVLALEGGTGNALSNSMVRSKKPSCAIFMQILVKSRHLESISHVFKKETISTQEGPALATIIPKEKKRGIFSSFMSIKATKGKNHEESETAVSPANIEEELSAIFSTTNFELEVEISHSLDMNDNDVDINIDDIDLEEPKDKPKGQSILTLNKQKLAGTLNTFKGKLKPRKAKTENKSTKEENEDAKSSDTIDQIKKRYGYSTSSVSARILPSRPEYSEAKIAQSKLQDNLEKLQVTPTA